MIVHCIPLAFSQCFVHLDVCLIIEKCVLLGLDWVEPIMQLFLARHTFMHISCILTLSFLYFCSGLWLCVLSLSLSLSLPDKLRMALKQKSTLTQNPFHSESSSSTNLPPLHVQFCNEKAYHDFSENFSKCDIHPKRHVILSDFADTALPNVIHTRGWESLCEIPLRCPIVFIQEFYSNMHGINTFVPQFTTVLWGTRILVTLDLISEILHVSQVAHLDYPSY